MTEPFPAERTLADAAAADNRRNFYRVLHVQPEAPLEVIKASWRTLMSRLRQHPDLGGSDVQAQLINQAWSVLSDPQRRAAYDEGLRRQWLAQRNRGASPATLRPTPSTLANAFTHGVPTVTTPSSAGGSVAKMTRAAPAPAAPVAARRIAPAYCPLCGHAATGVLRVDSRCTRCEAPLAPLPETGRAGHELFGRRDAVRRDQSHVATLRVGFPATPVPVRWRDLSLSGLSLYATTPLAPGTRIHVIDSALETVAEVVRSRPQGQLHVVHARLLSALLLQATGVFVSAQA